MVKEIEKSYQWAMVVFELEKAVEYARVFLDKDTIETMDRIFPSLTELCKDCIREDIELGKRLWEEVKGLTDVYGDLTELGDRVSLCVLPLVREFIALHRFVPEQPMKGLSLIYTLSGFLSLRSEDRGINLHSCDDPMFEARQYIRSFYQGDKSVYYVYGCGLGYQLCQLSEISDGFTKAVLYEPNDEIYDAAHSYGVMDILPQGFCERRAFEGIDDFLTKAQSENAGVLIHFPSAKVIEDPEEQRKLITHWMWQNTVRRYEKGEFYNISRNDLLHLPDAEEFKGTLKGKGAVVVAAGPSLSENLEVLREMKKDKVIVAVGHVYKMLLQNDIRPDYVVMIDPQKNMVKQIPEDQPEDIPLLIDPNAYWKLPRIHMGPAYMMRRWEYGGTVASAALEAAIQMGAGKVYLVGLDLGYPILQSHADGIDGGGKMDPANLFEIPAMDGGKVLTDKHMDYYRKQIEVQIGRHPEIAFINLSRHGARISGTGLYAD